MDKETEKQVDKLLESNIPDQEIFIVSISSDGLLTFFVGNRKYKIEEFDSLSYSRLSRFIKLKNWKLAFSMLKRYNWIRVN